MSIKEEVRALCSQAVWPPEEPSVPSATNEEIVDAEASLRMSFPPELREFLLFLNGPCIGPGGIFGISTKREYLDIRRILERHPVWKDRGWIPVAGDGCGNYYVAVKDAEGFPVCFIDTIQDELSLAYVVASDVWMFVWFLLGAELRKNGWPFDRGYLMAHDPAIAGCTVAPMPWDA